MYASSFSSAMRRQSDVDAALLELGHEKVQAVELLRVEMPAGICA
jgi:hypothetical protein